MRRFLLLAALLPALLLLTGCGGGDGDDEPSGGGAVELAATEFAFEPAEVSVDEAGEATFTVSNDGQAPHALALDGNGVEEETGTISPGESASLTVDLEPGEYELYCPVGDHRDQGIAGTLVVRTAAGAGMTDESGSDDDESSGYGSA